MSNFLCQGATRTAGGWQRSLLRGTRAGRCPYSTRQALGAELCCWTPSVDLEQNDTYTLNKNSPSSPEGQITEKLFFQPGYLPEEEVALLLLPCTCRSPAGCMHVGLQQRAEDETAFSRPKSQRQTSSCPLAVQISTKLSYSSSQTSNAFNYSACFRDLKLG